MGDIILSIADVSKQYQLGEFGTGTIGRDVDRWWHKMRGKEDPYLKVGVVNDRASKEKADFVWALKNVNLEVERGEVLGVIGKNGAGKSTLLKLLSRITSPTVGSIKFGGRLASLLEVGTGFHPELTGRENIFLNGAILGMTKKEIINKFDEIVDFSGCELYIDTPTKRYSSGMTVRLGFAVAAFLDPEILIVDEVLAVGDAEFQLKAIGKMKSISKEEGRTVIFVSHNLNSIKQLCTRCALMEKGTLKFVGSVDECISKYLNVESAFDIEKISNKPKLVELPIFLQKCNFILKNKTDRVGSFNVEDQVCIKFEFNKTQDLTGVFLHLRISDENENLIIETDSTENSTNVFDTSRIGNLSVEYSFPPRTFNKGKYFISIGLASAKAVPFQIQSLDNFLSFEVLAYGTYRERHRRSLTAIIPQLDYQWF